MKIKHFAEKGSAMLNTSQFQIKPNRPTEKRKLFSPMSRFQRKNFMANGTNLNN